MAVTEDFESICSSLKEIQIPDENEYNLRLIPGGCVYLGKDSDGH
jgi:hypothetical protein